MQLDFLIYKIQVQSLDFHKFPNIMKFDAYVFVSKTLDSSSMQ